MEETLRPCPHCGAEAEVVRNSSGSYFARCTNRQCAAKTRLYHENEAGARLAWNRRAVQTCTVESSHTEWEDGEYSYLDVELSCGHAFTWDDVVPPDYCPYCGCEVVDE